MDDKAQYQTGRRIFIYFKIKPGLIFFKVADTSWVIVRVSEVIYPRANRIEGDIIMAADDEGSFAIVDLSLGDNWQ